MTPNDIPHSIEAERALLGSVFLEPSKFYVLNGLVKAEDFYLRRHALIWGAIKTVTAIGDGCDHILVAECLDNHGNLDAIGGRSYIVDLLTATGTSLYAEMYAQIVRRTSVRRAALVAADKIRDAALDESITLDDVMSKIDVSVKSVLMATDANTVYSMTDLASTALDRMERATQLRRNGTVLLAGISYGFADLDKTLLGAQAGQYIIACGRPGMGKSVFAVQAAYNFAKQGKRVRFFSTEMTQDEVFDRLITMHTGIPYYTHRSGAMTDLQMHEYTYAVAELSQLPIVIDSEAQARPSYIWRESLKQADLQGLDAIVVDGTYRLQTDGKHNSLFERGNEIATSMKNLARKLQVPLIGTHQVGRDGDQRPPALRDLQESGRYEQEADVVLGMWRESGNDTQQQIHVLKHRNGNKGIVNLYFDAGTMTFKNAAFERIDLNS